MTKKITPHEMMLALRAFKGCKRYLNTDTQPRRTSYICFAIDEWYYRAPAQRRSATIIAKNIVMRSIAPHHTMVDWMIGQGVPRKEAFSDAQDMRHAFVDACIAELERRLGGNS